MNDAELLQEVAAALAATDLAPFVTGGQKLVCTAKLAGQDVIVKIIRIATGPAGDEVLERARREVELLSAVSSEFVVAVLSEVVEIGEPIEAVCWVEEQLDGQDLRDILGPPTWSSTEIRVLIEDVACGLAACHDLDVVHRDLSPGNVRRRASGRFVVLDPGYARHLRLDPITGLYQPGTPGYLTPEHVPGGHPTPASDIFGVGVLAFQVATGALPVDPNVDPAAYYVSLRATPVAPPVTSMRPDLDPDLTAVIDRCLDRQPARRFIDAAELIDAMAALATPGATA